MFRSLRTIAISVPVVVVLSLATIATAQQTVNNASLGGRVTDASGAIIPGATVTARQTDTNVVSQTTTGKDGLFRFPYLPIGPYEVSVRAAGFAEAKSDVTLTVGAAFQLPISLKIGLASTSVTVSGETPVLETARSQIAETVSPREVNNLPLNGRNFLDLTLLLPGVSPTNTANTQQFAETSAVPGQGISINSQRNFSNSFITDGLSANDDASGLVGTFYGLDSIQEFQVVTSDGQAEFGRALGGYINIVTRSGTDTLHGDVYGYFRNQALNADNALTGTKLPMTQGQYGASLGGPILKDRTFYFVNFEQRLLNQAGSPVITITPANLAAVNEHLTAVGYQGPLLSTGQYPNPTHMNNLLAKLDHRFTDNDQFSGRYSLYHVNAVNSRGVGGFNAVSAAAGLHDLNQTLAVSNIFLLSPRTANETRAQYTHSNLLAPPNDPIGPAVSISGVATFGTLSASPTGRLAHMFEVVDNLSHQAGTHALRAGVDFLDDNVTITFPKANRGSYQFSSLANFLNGTYNTFTQVFGNPVVAQNNPNIGFYLQDQWQATQSLTLNGGVRYDWQSLKTLESNSGLVSPRLGFAWTPFGSHSVVIRGGFGIYYDRITLRPLANALLSANNTTNLSEVQLLSTTLNDGQTGAPVFPNILTTAPIGLPVSFATMDPHMKNPYAGQASLEVERQIGPRGALGVSYQHLRGIDLLASVNRNTPTCTAAVDPVNLCRPNPTYQNNKQYSPVADSQYDGLEVSYVDQPVNWGNVRVSFTYSKALDDVGEFFFSSPLNNDNIHQDWARSDDDQRHRLVVDTTLHTPTAAPVGFWQTLSHGFGLGGIVTYYSAPPFNITSGTNSIQTTSSRPCVGLAGNSTACTGDVTRMIGRNTGTGFDTFNVDARLSRTFAISERTHVVAMAEMFNVLNHPNYEIPNGTFGTGVYPNAPSSNFGRPNAVADPREVQLAVRIVF